MDELTQQMRDRLVEILLTSSRDEAIKYLRRQGVPEDRAIVYVDDEENRLLA
jgi:Mg/Co/Ni transporter MgtE